MRSARDLDGVWNVRDRGRPVACLLCFCCNSLGIPVRLLITDIEIRGAESSACTGFPAIVLISCTGAQVDKGPCLLRLV